jgi:hypothetical protein
MHYYETAESDAGCLSDSELYFLQRIHYVGRYSSGEKYSVVVYFTPQNGTLPSQLGIRFPVRFGIIFSGKKTLYI